MYYWEQWKVLLDDLCLTSECQNRAKFDRYLIGWEIIFRMNIFYTKPSRNSLGFFTEYEPGFRAYLAWSRTSNCSRPIIVQMGHFVRQLLQVVWCQIAWVVDHYVVCGRHSTLPNILRNHEEIIPAKTQITHNVLILFNHDSLVPRIRFWRGRGDTHQCFLVTVWSRTVPGFGFANSVLWKHRIRKRTKIKKMNSWDNYFTMDINQPAWGKGECWSSSARRWRLWWAHNSCWSTWDSQAAAWLRGRLCVAIGHRRRHLGI